MVNLGREGGWGFEILEIREDHIRWFQESRRTYKKMEMS